jgi:hypothetical protein
MHAPYHHLAHHRGTRLGVWNVVGLLVGSSVGSKTPASGCSRELWSIGTHWEAEGWRVVEGLGWGTGWCCTHANSAWEDGLVHIAHVANHSVDACCCTLVVFAWASHAGVVVVCVTAMREAVVPVLKPFYR